MMKYYSGMIDDGAWKHASGDIAVFGTKYRRDLQSLVVHLDPTTGRTGAKVYMTGKNIINADPFTLSMPDARTNGQALNGLPAYGEFTLSIYVSRNTIARNTTISLRDRSGSGYTSIATIIISSGATGTFTATFTCNGIAPRYIYSYISTLEAEGKEIEIQNIQLEVGANATPCEPYTGNTYTIDWQTEAGTVYGGELDVVSGVLTTGGSEYQLAPQQIQTLLGENVIWSDAGPVSVEYWS